MEFILEVAGKGNKTSHDLINLTPVQIRLAITQVSLLTNITGRSAAPGVSRLANKRGLDAVGTGWIRYLSSLFMTFAMFLSF